MYSNMYSKQVPVNRVQIIHDSDSKKAGIIELRRECPEVSMGDRKYGGVRFWLTDGTEIIGFAQYSDDLPDEIDIRVNDLDYDYLVKNGSTSVERYIIKEVPTQTARYDLVSYGTVVKAYEPQWNLFDWRSTPGSYIYYNNYEKTAIEPALVAKACDSRPHVYEDITISFPAYLYRYRGGELKEYAGEISIPIRKEKTSYSDHEYGFKFYADNSGVFHLPNGVSSYVTSVKEGALFRAKGDNQSVWFKEPNLKAAVDVFVKSEREKAQEWALKIAKSQQIIDKLNALVEEESSDEES